MYNNTIMLLKKISRMIYPFHFIRAKKACRKYRSHSLIQHYLQNLIIIQSPCVNTTQSIETYLKINKEFLKTNCNIITRVIVVFLSLMVFTCLYSSRFLYLFFAQMQCFDIKIRCKYKLSVCILDMIQSSTKETQTIHYIFDGDIVLTAVIEHILVARVPRK